MRRRILAILVTALMVFQTIPATAFAAADSSADGSAGQIGRYYDVDDKTGAIPNGDPELKDLTPNSYENGAVTVSKEIKPTETENVFDVTLKVSTTENVAKETASPDAAVVLVLDASRSMRTCAVCNHVHENSNKYGAAKGNCDEHNCDCNSSTVKLRTEAVREAAQEFINGFDSNSADRRIAIVEFSGYPAKGNDFVSGATTIQGWTDAKNLVKPAGSYCDAIADYSYRYAGTNIEAGLILAKNLLNDSSVSGFKNKNVILLSDGAPTYHVTDAAESSTSITAIATSQNSMAGSGQAGQGICALHDDPADVAAALRAAGVTTYAAYVGNDEVECSSCKKDQNGRDWLAQDCGFTAYSASNAEDIADIFAELIRIIEMKAQAWETTDPMGSNIIFDKFNRDPQPANEFVQTDGTISWDIKTGSIPEKEQNGDTTTYTYELSYQITLDTLASGFDPGKEYATNGVTGLTYMVENVENGESEYKAGTAYFNIPSVMGFEVETLEFNNAKVGETAIGSGEYELLEGAVFQVAHAENCPCSSTTEWEPLTAVTDADGSFGFEGIPSGHTYVMTELSAPEGYVPAAGSYIFNVEKGKAVEIADTLFDSETDKIINESTNYNIPVTKAWNDADDQDGIRAESITAGLFRAGSDDAVKTVTLDGSNKWSSVFENVPKYAEDGAEIRYEVREMDVPEGYTSGVTGSVAEGFTITNTHETEKTSVTVTKEWNDAEDQDGLRPGSVKVQLLANGVVQGDAVTLSEANDWTAVWSELDAKSGGRDIEYSVSEVDVPDGYTVKVTGSEENGFTVINTHEPELTEATVKKVWDDAEDQDGKRPESLTVTLSNGEEVVLSEANDWTATVKDLPKFAAGEEIAYTWTEGDMPEGYALASSEKEGTVTTLTNTYEVETTALTIKKSWDDADDQDGIRPESLVVTLSNGVQVTLNADNNWTETVENLPVYENGQKINYSWTEGELPEGYKLTETAVNGTVTTLTNTHTPSVIKIEGSKTWDDKNNQDGKRPDEINIKLLADGEVVKTATVTAADDWSWIFENMPVYENGREIEYTVSEEAVAGYETVVNGFDITNSYTPETVVIEGTKIWNDADDQDGLRPESVVINIKAGGTVVDTQVATADTNWTYKSKELPKYENGGKEIEYTVSEIKVDGYKTEVNGFDITNTHTPSVIKIEGSKTWDDADDQDGKRPDEITINLLANGEVVKTATVTAADNWAWSFENMPEFENGEKINYTVSETAVDGYSAVVSGYDVTNSYTPGKVNVGVTKAWDDANDQDGKRPETVTVTLYSDGSATDKTLVLSEANKWTGSFTDLDEYKAGQKIEYTVAEAAVEYYTAAITGTAADGFVITNTHTPETTDVAGNKIWDDNNNQDGVRPEAVTINLLANGTVVDSQEINAASNWAWNFTDLPKYADGEMIAYTVTEVVPEGYSNTIEDYVITNSYTPEETSVTVTKQWADADDQDGIRPDEITAKLMADGIELMGVKLNGENKWTATIDGLPKYRDGGVEIKYTFEEDAVDGYTSVVTGDMTNGFTLVNTHAPELTEVAGSKTWNDADDQDGVRPEYIKIKLMADGAEVKTVTVTEANEWAWFFTDLPKYRDGGVEIVYTIVETVAENYTTERDDFDVKNTYAPEQTSVAVTKYWADADDQDGIRPENVTVQLYADGKAVDGGTLKLNADNDWTAEFTALDKYRDGGVEIKYTVAEVEIAEGYEASVSGTHADGYVITNAHTPEVTFVEGTKTWDDADNQDGIRPDSITVNLYADGELFDTAAVTEADEWTWNFTDLPKYRDGGVEIKYTVDEADVAGYEPTIDGFNITNTHTPETADLNGAKIWDDADNQKGKRPESITVNLLADDEVIDTIEVTEADGWAWEFKDMPVYKDGQKILYTVSEAEVDGYNAAYNGLDITNTIKAPAVIALEGTKALEKDGTALGMTAGQFGFRLSDVEGNLIETVTNSEDGYFAFTEIEADAAGTYTYIISEVIPEDAEMLDEGIYVKDGILYDTAVYAYEVTVAEDENGNYAVKDAVLSVQEGSDWVAAESIIFVNSDVSEEDEDGGVIEPGDEGQDPTEPGEGGSEELDGTGESNDEAESDGASQTGDDSNMTLMAFVALAALAVAGMTFRRKRTE